MSGFDFTGLPDSIQLLHSLLPGNPGPHRQWRKGTSATNAGNVVLVDGSLSNFQRRTTGADPAQLRRINTETDGGNLPFFYP